MDLPADLLRRPAAEAVRWIARSQLDALERAAARLPDPADAEALHDARVALRRLRSTLSAWKRPLEGSVRRKDRARLRSLQRATGACRDAEAGCAWLSGRPPQAGRDPLAAACGWLAERLSRRVAAGRPEAARAFADLVERRGRRLRRRLSTVPSRLGDEADAPGRRFAWALARALHRRGERFADALGALEGAAQARQAHAVRVAGKRLRYLLEPVARDLPGADELLAQLRRLQDLLGTLQDQAALEAEVKGALREVVLAGARRQHRAARRGAAPAPAPRDPRRGGLLRLARDLASARAQSLAALHGVLSGEGLALRLRDGLRAVAEAARDAAHAGLEVERKYLLSTFPPRAPAGEVETIEQGWLPGEQLQERVRRVRRGAAVEHLRTVKLGRGLVRVELEEPADERTFAALWPLTEGCRVLKERTRVAVGEQVFELDRFLDRDLVLAEVELKSADEPVELPPWLEEVLVREVTGEAAYVNRVLAR